MFRRHIEKNRMFLPRLLKQQGREHFLSANKTCFLLFLFCFLLRLLLLWKNKPSSWSASVGCRQGSRHLLTSLEAFLGAFYLASPLPWFCYWCHVHIFLYPSGRLCHLAPDLHQMRTETPSPAKNDGDLKAESPSKAQALSGNCLTSCFYFHHLIPCLSASSDKIAAGHRRTQPGFIIQL